MLIILYIITITIIIIIETGKLKLAALVQYLPMAVIGGYLAYIGQYCFMAGISLMTNVPILSFCDWVNIFNTDSMVLLLPGVLLGFLLTYLVLKIRHFSVLPICLIIIPCIFYLILAISGSSLNNARGAFEHGWLANSTDSAYFWEVWEHYDVTIVYWKAIPPQIPSWLTMYFVVAFSSSLDVAAIQMENGKPLDFNHELRMVGVSNIVSGLTGGFTGSYIFTQTIFNMRSGVTSRLCGLVMIIMSMTSFFLPFSILAYIPRFFFGAVLTFIACDLVLSWLWHSKRLFSLVEYIVIWLTFLCINVINLEVGMVLGVGIAAVVFVIQYAMVNTTVLTTKRSNQLRGFQQRRILSELRDCIVAIELQGYIFFGSATNILKKVKHAVLIPNSTLELKRLSTMEIISDPVKQPTHYVVLNFSRVNGMDATAIRSCFIVLKQLLQQHHISLVFTNVNKTILKAFQAHGVISSDVVSGSNNPLTLDCKVCFRGTRL